MRGAVLTVSALFACSSADFRGLEPLPAGTELKLVIAWDGVTLDGALLRASDPTRVTIEDAHAAGRGVDVWIIPLTRAALDRAIPGISALDEPTLLGGIRPVIRDQDASSLALPASDVVLEVRAEPGGGGTIEYVSAARSEWAARPSTPDVGLHVDDPLVCGALDVEVFEVPAGVFPRAIAAAERDRAFVAATSARSRYVLLELGPGTTKTTTISRLGSPRESLSWEAAEGTLWGLDSTTGVYRIRPDGAAVPFPAHPNLSSPMELAAGRDGTVVALTFQSMAIPTLVLPPRASAWTVIDDLAAVATDLLRVSQHNRYAVYANCWAYVWALDSKLVPATFHWAVEAAGDGSCTSPPTDLAIDESQYLWLGNNRDLKRGKERGEVWPPFEHGIPITQDDQWPNALAAMGEERFAVAGKGGRVEVWIGSRWCIPPVEDPVDWTMGSGAEGTAWFVGSGRVLRASIQTSASE